MNEEEDGNKKRERKKKKKKRKAGLDHGRVVGVMGITGLKVRAWLGLMR